MVSAKMYPFSKSTVVMMASPAKAMIINLFRVQRLGIKQPDKSIDCH